MDMVLKENQYQPLTPNARIEGSLLKWDAVENIDSYIILRMVNMLWLPRALTAGVHI